MAYVIAEPCVNVLDRACVEVCPVQCFYEAGDQLVIHPAECVDCDACKPVCPTAAIFPLAEVPAEWQSYIQKNADWFAANPKPVKALTREEQEASGVASAELSKKLLAGAGEAAPPAAAAAHAPAGAPAAKATPKPAAPKVEVPAFPRAAQYQKGKALLTQLMEEQVRAGELIAAQTQAALNMAAELRQEIRATFGKTEVTLMEVEKKDIQWRQHEELARALVHCAEVQGPKQIKRRLRRKLGEYVAGFVCTSGLTVLAVVLAWRSVQDWTFTPRGKDALFAIFQPEGFAVGIAFGTMAAILVPFAIFAAYKTLAMGKWLVALGGFDRAATLRTLELQRESAGRGGARRGSPPGS